MFSIVSNSRYKSVVDQFFQAHVRLKALECSYDTLLRPHRQDFIKDLATDVLEGI
jgi:hypothetical protein